nr:MAG TPA: hypothetical protein [Caudoviricetes sp.]
MGNNLKERVINLYAEDCKIGRRICWWFHTTGIKCLSCHIRHPHYVYHSSDSIEGAHNYCKRLSDSGQYKFG